MLAYRAYLSEHTKHQSLEFLYGVARSLSRAPDIESALVDLLERTRESFNVRSAEIILFGAADDLPLRTSLDAAGVDADDAAGPARARRRAARLLRDEHAVVVDRARGAAGARDVHGRARHRARLAIAPVPGETRLVGVMLLGDRARRLGRLQPRRPAAVRDARRPRGHVARVRPAGAGDPPHARAAGRARAPGLPRPAHRPRQPRAVHAPRARVARPPAPAPGPCCSSTSTTSSASTTTPGTPRATRCSWPPPSGSAAACGPTDLAARLGGDEFAVLLEDADERHGEEVAHRIVALLCEAVTISGRPCWVRASIGIASAGAGSGMDADDLMRHADIAMYRAKEAGKGQVRAFTPDMHPNALTKAPSRDELLAALDAGEFVAHYQPIVSVETGESSPPRRSCAGTTRATGCSRPSRSCRPPRRPGRSRRSTGPCSSRRAARPPAWTAEDGYATDAAVHVNLSGEGLRTTELVGVVEDVLARTGLAPRRLVLELTESVLIAEMPTAQPVLAALRALGVRIALDDFGTGYSSLACLRSLPVDILKVAKPFVDGAGRTPHDHALLAMIIELGSLFGVSVVAEGIERQDQLDALADLQLRHGPGLLPRPSAGRRGAPLRPPRPARRGGVAAQRTRDERQPVGADRHRHVDALVLVDPRG